MRARLSQRFVDFPLRTLCCGIIRGYDLVVLQPGDTGFEGHRLLTQAGIAQVFNRERLLVQGFIINQDGDNGPTSISFFQLLL